MTSKELSREWHEAIHAQYDPVLKASRRAGTYGGTLTARPTQREQAVNVSPSLSPDGTRVVYLSERGLLSVDLYLAEAETGRIIRKLVNTAVDPHLTSLQFIGSAGSWHPNGKQFVLGAIRDGQAELAVLDVNTGRTVQELPFPALGEILNPSWSPDGRSIAFSATSGGYSDLFIYDLDRGSLRQVTHDGFADLQPAWAPDGRRLAFVTDRFSTNLAVLHAGSYGLALLDPATDRIEPLPTFDRGKSINPQWSPDGRHLYFLSDRTGLTNIYVMDVTSRQVRQVTDLDAGASGITALSPALSSPLDANRLAFSAYDDGQLGIYTVDEPAVLSGVPVTSPRFGTSAAALSPEQRASGTLTNLLGDPTTGLPPGAGGIEPYRPRLSLDFVGQPYVSVGVDRFGTSYGGGLSFLWSDMLGNHNLMATIDANTYGTGFSSLLKNTGGLLAYQNLTRRWNWGVAVQQSPYLAGGVLSGITTSGGQPAYVEQTIIQRQTYRGMNGVVSYPFDRARRLELGAGYDQLTYGEEVRTILTSLRTGRLISDETNTSTLAKPLRLGSASVASVIDTSVFGATSPVAGQRSRIEISPTFGSISLATATADYRRYFMPASFYTIAGRILHIGRYGGDSEDSRLLPLFIGYPELVRGYGIGSFSASECTASSTGSCPEFDRLLGSRMLVGNLEFRFPLLRPFGVRSGMYGPLPTEVGLFADSGVAWHRGERPSLFGGDRQAVSSAGVTFRTNLLNFTIAQIDLAHPFQRPGRGWIWMFSLTPGF